MMSKRKQPTGVGRGNGEGSKATQFQPGQPSGNMKGRPKKPKPSPARSMEDALVTALQRDVIVDDGGRKKKVPRYEAVIDSMFDSFSSATPNAKMRMLQLFSEMSSGVDFNPPMFAEDAIRDFVNEIYRRRGEESPYKQEDANQAQ